MSNQQSSNLVSLHEDGLHLLDLNETTSSLYLPLSFTLPAQTEPMCILHCRGWLCLTLEGNNDLEVWNPTSKKHITRIPMAEPGQTTNPLGFGYDQVSDDYKIVTIINNKTYIYAFKKLSWRESIPNPSLDCIFKNRTGTTVDHCMYWIADRSHTRNPLKESTILCFDFANENYQELFYPMHTKNTFGSWLSVLRGELCIIDHYPSLDDDMCVWFPERRDKKIKKWNTDPWINMKKTLKEFKKGFGVGFACVARNDEIFIVVKGKGNGEDKVMVYNEEQGKFIEVSFGCSLKGYRCMTNYMSIV